MKKSIFKNTRFMPLTTWRYRGGYFQGGFVKNSPHKSNTIYIRISILQKRIKNIFQVNTTDYTD